MRIYRDSRFSKDKTPYKPISEFSFDTDAGKDIHAPRFLRSSCRGRMLHRCWYLHPDAPTLTQIRAAIDENQKQWSKVKSDTTLNQRFRVVGRIAQDAHREAMV